MQRDRTVDRRYVTYLQRKVQDISPILKRVYLGGSEFEFDWLQNLKKADFADLEGLLNFLIQKEEHLADLCEALFRHSEQVRTGQ